MVKKEFGGELPKIKRNRQSQSEYKSSNAGLTGFSFKDVVSPGQLYQLDETPFNEELVSIYDPFRTTKIGKATLYFLRDQYSKAIAGVYITTQSPSYSTAKEALFNAARNKAGFLEEIGCPINPILWPIQGAPSSLLVDKAEFHNSVSEGPITDLPITIRFARLPSDKGLIEVMFNVFRRFFENISKSNQTKSLHDISKQLARKKACLTINELYIISVIFIVHFNSKHVIDDFPLNKEMVEDGVRKIPNDIYAWGVKNRPGGLNYMSDDQYYLKLLEKGEVSVHREFVYLKKYGIKYTCDWTLTEGLQDRKLSGNRVKKFPCRYFRGNVDRIFISTPEGFKLAELHNDDSGFSGFSFPEVIKYKEENRVKNETLKIEEDNSLALAEEILISFLKNAQDEKVDSPLPNLSTINGNRKVESIFDRVKQATRFLSAVDTEYGGFSNLLDEKLESISTESENHVFADLDRYLPNEEDSDFYDEG